MRMRCRIIDGEPVWYDPASIPRPEPVAPYIWSDMREYLSPVTWTPVDGRRAHREDLAKHGARVLEPSEKPNLDTNKTFATDKDIHAAVRVAAEKMGLHD